LSKEIKGCVTLGLKARPWALQLRNADCGFDKRSQLSDSITRVAVVTMNPTICLSFNPQSTICIPQLRRPQLTKVTVAYLWFPPPEPWQQSVKLLAALAM